METDRVARGIGTVALVIAAANLVGLVAPMLVASGWLGWLFPPMILQVLSALLPTALIAAAGLVLLGRIRPDWRTVALAFLAVSGLLQLPSIGHVLLGQLRAPGFEWGYLSAAASTVGLVLGVVALAVLSRGTAGSQPRPRGQARAVALGGAVALALATLVLPTYRYGEETFGSLFDFIQGSGPRTWQVWVLLAFGAAVPIIALAAVAWPSGRDAWTGAVGAVALHAWLPATTVIYAATPSVPGAPTPAIGAYVTLLAMLMLVAAVVLDRRSDLDGPPGGEPAGSVNDPSGRDPEPVDA